MKLSTDKAELLLAILWPVLIVCFAIGLETCWADSLPAVNSKPFQTLDISGLDLQRQEGSLPAFTFQQASHPTTQESSTLTRVLNWLENLNKSQSRTVGGVNQSQPRGLDPAFHVPSNAQYFLEHPESIFDEQSVPYWVDEPWNPHSWSAPVSNSFFDAVAL